MGNSEMKALTTATFLSLIGYVAMYSRGAPNSTCITMMPGHGKPKQSGPSPYTLTFSKQTYSPNEKITVKLSGDATFKGFLIKPTKAPPTITQQGIGLPGVQFSENAELNNLPTDSAATLGSLSSVSPTTNKCEIPALTHTDNSTKRSVVFTWRAPSTDQGPIVFRYTVVQSKDIYWVNMVSEEIIFNQDSATVRVKPSGLALILTILSRIFKRWF